MTPQKRQQKSPARLVWCEYQYGKASGREWGTGLGGRVETYVVAEESG